MVQSAGNVPIAIYIKIWLWLPSRLKTDNDLSTKSSMSLHIDFSSLQSMADINRAG